MWCNLGGINAPVQVFCDSELQNSLDHVFHTSLTDNHTQDVLLHACNQLSHIAAMSSFKKAEASLRCRTMAVGILQGVVLTRNAGGRPTGEAFLQSPSAEAQSHALQLNRARMGNRYIEIFVASWPDMQQVHS